jgi:hypothetical protein
MTQIDKEAVERMGNWLALNAPPEHIDAYNSLHATLDAAEARERAAVAAAYETAADQWHETRVEGGVAVAAVMAMSDRIRALADTDALAEYVERVDVEAYLRGWKFAYHQWENTGSVPDPEYTPAALAEDDTPGEKEGE